MRDIAKTLISFLIFTVWFTLMRSALFMLIVGFLGGLTFYDFYPDTVKDWKESSRSYVEQHFNEIKPLVLGKPSEE